MIARQIVWNFVALKYHLSKTGNPLRSSRFSLKQQFKPVDLDISRKKRNVENVRVSLVSLKLNHQVHVPMEKQIPCRHHGVFDLFLEAENSPFWCLS